MRTLLFTMVIVCGSINIARAHTHLEKASPADGATLSSAPKEVILEFSEPTRVTAATVQKEGEKQSTVLKPAGKAAAATVSLPLSTSLSAGKYVVTWRALGADNHVMSGKLHFSIAPR